MIEHDAFHQHLEGTGRDEMACKTAPVQEKVSRIVVWRIFFDAIPGLCHLRRAYIYFANIYLTLALRGILPVMYFNALADKRGYRIILTLYFTDYLLLLLWVLMTC